MNDDAFGAYEVTAPPSSLNTNGKTWYKAQITSAQIARNASGDPIKGKEDDKTRVDVRFTIPEVTNNVTGKPEELSRRFVISYGQSNAGTKPWAAWSQFLKAATNVNCGDARQKQIGPKHLEGKWVELCPVLSETGYVNVKEISAVTPQTNQQRSPQAAPQVARRPEPVAVAAAPVEDQYGEDPFSNEDLPF